MAVHQCHVPQTMIEQGGMCVLGHCLIGNKCQIDTTLPRKECWHTVACNEASQFHLVQCNAIPANFHPHASPSWYSSPETLFQLSNSNKSSYQNQKDWTLIHPRTRCVHSLRSAAQAVCFLTCSGWCSSFCLHALPFKPTLCNAWWTVLPEKAFSGSEPSQAVPLLIAHSIWHKSWLSNGCGWPDLVQNNRKSGLNPVCVDIGGW